MDYFQKYQKYKTKYLNKKVIMMDGGSNALISNDNINGGGSNKLDLILFKAEWCGHCKNFKSIWNQLEADEDLNKKNNFILKDADADKEEIRKLNIQGYPTLMLNNRNNELIEYEGEHTFDKIKAFLIVNIKL